MLTNVAIGDEAKLEHALCRRQPLLLFAFAILNIFYFTAIFGSAAEIASCCDTIHYLQGSVNLFKDGLLFENPYGDYRSYLNYALVRAVTVVGANFFSLPADPSQYYIYGSLFLFGLLGAILIIALGKKPGFIFIFAAIYLNPITFAYLPYPLQESQIVLFLGPVIVLIMSTLSSHPRLAIAALPIFAATAWMLKGSLVLIAIPSLCLGIYMALYATNIFRPAIIGLGIATAIVVPQSYIAMERYGSIYPYPNSSIFEKQLVWGYSSWRYETVKLNGKWAASFKKNHFKPILNAEEYYTRMKTAPLEVAALWVGHLIGSLDHSKLQIYITSERYAFSIFNVFIGGILFLGVSQWLSVVLRGGYARADFFIDAIMIGGLSVLPFLAVETRFSVLPVIALTFRFMQSLPKFSGITAIRDVVLATIFGLVFALAITVMNG